MGDFDEGESALHRAREITEPQIDPAAAALLHLVTGMLHAARGQHQAALEAFATGARAQSLLTGVHALATPVVGWLAATQARLGMPDEARATLTGFSAEHERTDFICNARAVICLTEGDPTAALDLLQDLRDAPPPVGVPAFMLVETHLLAGIAHLRLGDRHAAAVAAEAALAAAEPDRLIFPFALTEAAELLDVFLHHETAHGALLADIVDQLLGASAPGTDRERLSQSDGLSPSELRVLGYLPTNLTRTEIAQELHVSIHTVSTHIRNVFAKLGVRDRSAAVQRARQLRLLSNRPSPTSPQSSMFGSQASPK
jgi:LuxR family maltose regulon positive regulatory protein